MSEAPARRLCCFCRFPTEPVECPLVGAVTGPVSPAHVRWRHRPLLAHSGVLSGESSASARVNEGSSQTRLRIKRGKGPVGSEGKDTARRI